MSACNLPILGVPTVPDLVGPIKAAIQALLGIEIPQLPAPPIPGLHFFCPLD